MSSDADETYLQHLADVVNERVQALGPKAEVVDTAIRRIDQRLQADAELAQQIDP